MNLNFTDFREVMTIWIDTLLNKRAEEITIGDLKRLYNFIKNKEKEMI